MAKKKQDAVKEAAKKEKKAAKQATKTARSTKKKGKKDGEESEEDVEIILRQLQIEEAKKNVVTVTVCDRPSARANFSLVRKGSSYAALANAANNIKSTLNLLISCLCSVRSLQASS